MPRKKLTLDEIMQHIHQLEERIDHLEQMHRHSHVYPLPQAQEQPQPNTPAIPPTVVLYAVWYDDVTCFTTAADVDITYTKTQ